MATNLLIGYPDIPFSAGAPTIVSGTEDSTYIAKNLITGPRAHYFTLSAVAGVIDIKFDLGASLTKSIDYCWIARAKVAKSQGATQAMLRSSSDDVTYTNRIGTSSNLATRTFTGPRSEDLMFASGFNDEVAGSLPTSAFRYWKLQLGVASPTKKWLISKLYFGTLFDFGKDPLYTTFAESVDTDANQNREPAARFTMRWEGISNTKRNSFIDLIYKYREVSPVVLYDTNDYIFHGWKTMHCRIESAEFSPISVSNNVIEVMFVEEI